MTANHQWCASCPGDEKEITYEGWALFVRSESGWTMHPHREGRGGTGWLLAEGAVDADWPEADAFAAQITLVAQHPSAKEPFDGLLDVGPRHVARKATETTSAGGVWRCKVLGQPRLDIPHFTDLTNDQSNRLQHAQLWVWDVSTGERKWQFEDADARLVAPPTVNRERRAWQGKRQQFVTSHEEVNPYNFVPLGQGTDRSRPVGHHRLAEGHLSGRIDVQLTAVSPLALPGAGSGTQTDPYRPARVGTADVLPGSSLAGAVRSFHEALTDSCLRVVDRDYVPIHRDLARPQSEHWRMGIIGASGTEVRLCDPITYKNSTYAAIWVEARWLSGSHLSSEQLFHFDPTSEDLHVPHKRGRLELKSSDRRTPTRCTDRKCEQIHWRTIVTAALPGRVLEPRNDQHPYHLAFAPESQTSISIPAEVADAYISAANDSGDVVVARRPGATTPSLAVRDVGQRQLTAKQITEGRVMWVELNQHRVVRITPSVLWRSPGQGVLKERIHGYEPCADADRLCPSCRLFGAAEERETPDKESAARVAAYRGHIRFGHAEISALDVDPTHLREMGTPRPSAGQFYLDNGQWDGKQAAEEQRPLREWGSAADRKELRPIRGRKFYWTQRTGDRHRVQNGTQGNEAMTSYHRLSPPGTTLKFSVWFDNVSPEQLGALLVSLDPNLLCSLRDTLGDRLSFAADEALRGTLGWHIGRGKGLGLGSVLPELVYAEHPARVDNASVDAEAAPVELTIEVRDAEHYRKPSSPARRVNALDVVTSFTKAADVSTWGPLLALSSIGWVPPSMLTYPQDDEPAANFRFDYWKRSTGAPGTVRVRAGGREAKVAPVLVALPRADDASVAMRRPWLDEVN